MTTAIKIRKGDTLVDGRAWDLESCVVKALGDSKDHRYLVVASFDAEDRDGETIDQAGWVLDYYRDHPVLVDSHDYSGIEHQIGQFTDYDFKAKSFQGVTEYYANQGNKTADWAAYLASRGAAAYSVGFIPLESQPHKSGGRRYTSQELLELSQVIVPSSRQALQLAAKGSGLQARLARELLTDFETERRRPRVWRGATVPRQKWDSQFMESADGGDGYWGPRDTHCIVPGCDDASQTMMPVCSEHLRVLMNSDAEPAGSPPDDDAVMRMLVRSVRRVTKAGRTISGANLGHLHSAMQSLGALHDAGCSATDCPLDDDEPPTSRDKGRKAAAEGSGSEGGFTVGADGKHGPVDGDTTHAHSHTDGAGDQHKHEHFHEDGSNSHSNADHTSEHKAADPLLKSHSELPDSAFACVDAGGTKEDGKTTPLSLRHYPHHTASGAVDLGLLRSALSRIADPDNEQCGKAHLDAHAKAEGIGEAATDKATNGLDPQALVKAAEAHLSAALEGIEW